MSVSPDTPLNLVEHRRPPEFGGIGTDPVWMTESETLIEGLTYRADPDDPERHSSRRACMEDAP